MNKSIPTLLLAAAALGAPVASNAGQQSGVLSAVVFSDYTYAGRTFTAMIVNFVPGTPYSGPGVNPPCIQAANPDWVFDMSTTLGQQSAETMRLAIATGRQVRIGSKQTCVLLGPNTEDAGLITLF